MSGLLLSRKVLAGAALAAGVVLIVVAVVYWAEPARSLPGLLPGHENSRHHHLKHGIAAFLVGLATLAFAWFQSGQQHDRVQGS